VIFGGAGDDDINGGTGADVLLGEAGADAFTWVGAREETDEDGNTIQISGDGVDRFLNGGTGSTQRTDVWVASADDTTTDFFLTRIPDQLSSVVVSVDDVVLNAGQFSLDTEVAGRPRVQFTDATLGTIKVAYDYVADEDSFSIQASDVDDMVSVTAAATIGSLSLTDPENPNGPEITVTQTTTGIVISIYDGTTTVLLASTSIESLYIDASAGADQIEVHDLEGSGLTTFSVDLGESGATNTVSTPVLGADGNPERWYLPGTTTPFVDDSGNPLRDGDGNAKFYAAGRTMLDADGELLTYRPIAPLTFDAAAIDTNADTISLPGNSLQSGDALVYQPSPASGGIGGLLAGQTYFIIRQPVDSDQIQLASSFNNATSAKPVRVNLVSAGTGVQQLSQPRLYLGNEPVLDGDGFGDNYHAIEFATNFTTSISHSATDGSFALNVSEVAATNLTTGRIEPDASAASIESALESLDGIEDVTVSGSGMPSDPWKVSFIDPSPAAAPLVTAHESSLETTNDEDAPLTIATAEEGHQIDLVTNKINLPEHGLQTGELVVYSVAEDNNDAIGGLVDGRAYYVISLNADSFQLAESLDDDQTAAALPVDLSLLGSGTHRIGRAAAVLALGGERLRDASGAVLSSGSQPRVSARGDQVRGLDGRFVYHQPGATVLHRAGEPMLNSIGEQLYQGTSQEIAIAATGGTFTLTLTHPTTLADLTTSDIPFDATSEDLEAALEDLAGIDDVEVSGSGTESDPWFMTLLEPSPTIAPQLAADGALLTSDDTPEVTIATVADPVLRRADEPMLDADGSARFNGTGLPMVDEYDRPLVLPNGQASAVMIRAEVPGGGNDMQQDTITIHGGENTIHGDHSLSVDTVSITNSEDQVIVDHSGRMTVTLINSLRAGGDQLIINGNGGNDELNAATLDRDLIAITLDAAAGDDVLVGSNYDDLLKGGIGSDTFTGNAGRDSFEDSSPAGDTDTLIESQDLDMTLTGSTFFAGKIVGDDPTFLRAFAKGSAAAEDPKAVVDPKFPAPVLTELQDTGDYYAAPQIEGERHTNNGGEPTSTFKLLQGPVLSGTLHGSIYHEEFEVQTFMMDANGDFTFTKVGNDSEPPVVPEPRVVSGQFEVASGLLELTWDTVPRFNKIEASYSLQVQVENLLQNGVQIFEEAQLLGRDLQGIEPISGNNVLVVGDQDGTVHVQHEGEVQVEPWSGRVVLDNFNNFKSQADNTNEYYILNLAGNDAIIDIADSGGTQGFDELYVYGSRDDDFVKLDRGSGGLSSGQITVAQFDFGHPLADLIRHENVE
ncbi:MAG: Ca2+-binding RTX toxin-like protein, partial [Pirellulaceae bacterium]